MGQYYLTVNIDKEQYLYPHKFGEGLKLMEFGNDGGGILTALAVLLSDGNGRGGGDLNTTELTDPDKLVGSWAGDRIVVAGDYADNGNFTGTDDTNLYQKAEDTYEDISSRIIKVLYLSDSCIREEFDKIVSQGWAPPLLREILEGIQEGQTTGA